MTDAAIAIPNLLYTYADMMDAGDFLSAARLFRHGHIVAGGHTIAGDEAIAALWRDHVRLYPDGTPRTRHITTNPIIEMSEDGQSATCRSQYIVLQQTDDFPLQPIITGRYRDSFARIDGKWCFIERIYAQIDLVGDTSAHTPPA